jgi:hypothetical protein
LWLLVVVEVVMLTVVVEEVLVDILQEQHQYL